MSVYPPVDQFGANHGVSTDTSDEGVCGVDAALKDEVASELVMIAGA